MTEDQHKPEVSEMAEEFDGIVRPLYDAINSFVEKWQADDRACCPEHGMGEGRAVFLHALIILMDRDTGPDAAQSLIMGEALANMLAPLVAGMVTDDEATPGMETHTD